MDFYTIIDIWETDEVRDCWIAHFENKEDAKQCFIDHLHQHTPGLTDDAIQNGFNFCLTGSGFPYEGQGEFGTLFVRNEKIQTKFDPKEMPWA